MRIAHLKRARRCVLLLLTAALVVLPLALPQATAAQVTVAPVGVFMEDSNPFGTLNVANGSGTAQEVEVGFRFGYPATDSLGNVFMQYEDSTAKAKYSMAPYLRAFPKQFVLPPGQSQVVRITAQPPGGRDDQYYWTRVVTTATPQSTFRDTAAEEGVQARVQFRLQQVTSLLYKKGEPPANISVENLSAAVDSGRVVVTTRIERGVGAPFLGRAVVQLRGPDGNVVQATRQSLATYFSQKRCWELPLPEEGNAAGPYNVTLKLTPERSDVPPQHRINMQPVTASTSLALE